MPEVDHVINQIRSGLTISSYCKAHGMPQSKFYKLKAEAKKSAFIAVEAEQRSPEESVQSAATSAEGIDNTYSFKIAGPGQFGIEMRGPLQSLVAVVQMMASRS